MPSRTFTGREKRSVPCFKASGDRLTHLSGAPGATGDLKLKPVFIDHSRNPTTLKNCATSTQPVLYKWNSKVWVTAHLFTTWFTEYFKPTVQACYSREKKMSFKILLLIEKSHGH